MPEIGEIRKSKELGYKSASGNSHIWVGCEICGKERWVFLLHGKPNSRICRLCCYRENHPSWKGGKRTKDDYIYVSIAKEDFYHSMGDKGGWVLEHRLVMAKHLGRCLLQWEIIHHKNGIKNDNRLENLELINGKRFHIVDSQVKNAIRRLNIRVEKQNSTIEELQKQISYLNGR